MNKIIRKIALKLRYPKLILLAVSIFAGYLIYTDQNNFHFHDFFENIGPFGIFCCGLLFAHGFTAGPAIAGLLLIGKTHPFLMSGVLATAGTLIGNVIVYQKLRISYHEEFDSLSQHPLFKWMVNFLDKVTPQFVRRYILPAFAGILTATPLPDEFSVALVHASKGMSVTVFTFVSFVFSAFGVFIILFIGKYL